MQKICSGCESQVAESPLYHIDSEEAAEGQLSTTQTKLCASKYRMLACIIISCPFHQSLSLCWCMVFIMLLYLRRYLNLLPLQYLLYSPTKLKEYIYIYNKKARKINQFTLTCPPDTPTQVLTQLSTAEVSSGVVPSSDIDCTCAVPIDLNGTTYQIISRTYLNTVLVLIRFCLWSEKPQDKKESKRLAIFNWMMLQCQFIVRNLHL